MKVAPLFLLIFLIACGGPDIAATSTRAAEVTQVAAITAPIAAPPISPAATIEPTQPASAAPVSAASDTEIGAARTATTVYAPPTATSPPAPPLAAPPAPEASSTPAPTATPPIPTATPTATATATATAKATATPRPTMTPAPRVPTPTAISKGILQSKDWRFNDLPMPGSVRVTGVDTKTARFWWSGTEQDLQRWYTTNWGALGLKPDNGRGRLLEDGGYLLPFCSGRTGTADAKCVTVITYPVERIKPANDLPFGPGSVYVTVSDGR